MIIDESKRDIGMEILEGIREIQSGGGRRFTVEMPPIAAIRQRIGISQAQFAKLLGVSIRTLQEWEQDRRQPSGAAQSLLILADKRPDVLREVLLS
ncbi:MAG: transcriptional regulator [Chloroflexi bacterium HGW-Chloroflexi-1]|nr:MAG: transcriptional regulator [Chloroflexi bacterium HGW-Chloroflexi-1]